MGTLTMIVGPMYAGKTTKLIELADFNISNNRSVMLFKPDADTRYHATKIVTHDGVAIDSVVIDTLAPSIQTDAEVVFIDELHLFHESIIDIIHSLLKNDIDVVTSGVNKDFRGEPIRNFRELFPHADEVFLLHSKCARCGEKAHLSQRLIEGEPANYNDPIIKVGSVETYEPRCKRCHKVTQ